MGIIDLISSNMSSARLRRIVGCTAFALTVAFGGAWSSDPSAGVALTSDTDASKYDLQIVDGGDGEKVFVWSEYNSSQPGEIYAQRLDAAGQLLWGPEGVVVCRRAESSFNPSAVSDGARGVIITWAKNRIEPPPGTLMETETDIYAQRLDPQGVPLWQSNGIQVTSSPQLGYFPQATSDGAGGVIVAYLSGTIQPSSNFPPGTINAQRISSSGVVQWPGAGAVIREFGDLRTILEITSDGSNGAIVAWNDKRTSSGWQVHGQRISAVGSALWQSNGVPISKITTTPGNTSICYDNSGGVYVLWQEPDAKSLYVQRLDGSGAAVLPSNGLFVSTNYMSPFYGHQRVPEGAVPSLAPDGFGGALMAWVNLVGGVYSQRLTTANTFAWAPGGVPVIIGNPALVADGSGGAIYTGVSHEGSFYVPTRVIYAQHLSEAGEQLWSPSGVKVYTGWDGTILPIIASDDRGGAIVAWKNFGELYANRISSRGVVAPKASASDWQLFE